MQVFPGTDIHERLCRHLHALDVEPGLHAGAHDITDKQFWRLPGSVLARCQKRVQEFGESGCPYGYTPGVTEAARAGFDDDLFNPVVVAQFDHIGFVRPIAWEKPEDHVSIRRLLMLKHPGKDLPVVKAHVGKASATRRSRTNG